MNIFDTNQKWYSFCYAWNLIWATFDSIFVSHLLGFPIARSINTNSIHYCDRSSRIFGFLNELVSFILTDEFTFRFFFIKKKKTKSIRMEMKSTYNFTGPFFTFFMKKFNAINEMSSFDTFHSYLMRHGSFCLHLWLINPHFFLRKSYKTSSTTSETVHISIFLSNQVARGLYCSFFLLVRCKR